MCKLGGFLGSRARHSKLEEDMAVDILHRPTMTAALVGLPDGFLDRGSGSRVDGIRHDGGGAGPKVDGWIEAASGTSWHGGGRAMNQWQ